MRFASPRLLVPLFLICAFGCSREVASIPERRPRPVTAVTLTEQLPPHASLVSASVGSWKTEQIGFEVNGRVEFVVEPNTEIEGRVSSKDGELLIPGTPIGRVESERYQLQVDKATADVSKATQSLAAAQTELNEGLPAQVVAATASRDLAKIEYDRSLRLYQQNAGAKGDVDRDKANYENAMSQLRQLDSAKKAKQAEVESLQAVLLQSQQNLRDAQRNLEDCTLYSSFRGQIANVSVVPGSVVSVGQPVATIQMMDPIKVELEVSAEDSRRLQKTEVLPVKVTLPDGTVEMKEGYLYLIDPVADPLTRTFTVTLLVMNRKLVPETDADITATTDQTWRLDFQFLPGTKEGMLFAAEAALLQDEQGYYLWQVTNTKIGLGPPPDQIYEVRKLRVTLGDLAIPFLGNWIFQQVIVDDEQFVPEEHMVLGELTVTEGKPEEWDGQKVKLNGGAQWLLRPGDLVQVDLSRGKAEAGFYVPMDAIVRENGGSYLFVVQQNGDQTVAVRKPVEVESAPTRFTSGLRRLSTQSGKDLAGQQYITRGAHYLVDGEPVRVVPAQEAAR